MTIGLDADGRLLVQSPGGSREFSKGVEELKSKRRLEAGEWAHVAIINNGREIRVFLDGEPIQGAIPTPSWGVWNKASFLYLGGQKLDNNPFKKGRKRQFLWEYRYAGDISDLRITGRPLAPSEFLYSQSPGG
jgi:hypothetical protein